MRVILSPDFKLLKFCFLKQPNFDLIFSNEFGHHSSLQNLPILTDIINRQIYLLLSETLVAPNFIEIPIPEPSEKKTKKSEQEDEADVQADNGEYSSDDLESNNDDELSSRGSDEDTIEEDQSRQRITNRKTKRSTRPTSNKK